jgi:uncharacterized protein (DUF427 family)
MSMWTSAQPRLLERAGGDPDGAGSCPWCGTDLQLHAVIVDGVVQVCDRCLHEVPSPRLAWPTGGGSVVVQAVWGGVVLADSSQTVHLTGVAYFPPGQVQMQHLDASGRARVDLSRGEAHLFDVLVAGRRCVDAAWHWPRPSPMAAHLPGWIGFGSAIMLTARPARPCPDRRPGIV